MPNYYLDNEDLQFYMQFLDLSEMIKIRENDFKDAEIYDYAPESVEDALDNYRRFLTISGDIAGNYMAPRSSQNDRDGVYLKDGVVQLAKGTKESIEMLDKAGFASSAMNRKYGGNLNPSTIEYMSNEMLSRADPAAEAVHSMKGLFELVDFLCPDDVRDKYMYPAARGEITAAMLLTEPGAGSDVEMIRTRAYIDDDGQWRVNGVKRFITNGCADVLFVLATTEKGGGALGLSALLVDKGPEVVIRRVEKKLGIRSSPTCEIQFNDAPAILMGERGKGAIYTLSYINAARLSIAVQSVGIAQAAFTHARNYADTRIQFGEKIQNLPLLREMLIEMQMQIESARILAYTSTHILDMDLMIVLKLEKGWFSDKQEKRELQKKQRNYRRINTSFLAPAAKYYASEMAVRVTSDAIQVLGGNGYMQDYPVEQFFRDARITPIYEGTSQLHIISVMRGVISGTTVKIFEKYDDYDFNDREKEYAAMLQEARDSLNRTITFLKEKKDNYFNEVHAQTIADMGIDIYVGYIFLEQSRFLERKWMMAMRHIKKAVLRVKMGEQIIMLNDNSTKECFDEIVGPVKEEL